MAIVEVVITGDVLWRHLEIKSCEFLTIILVSLHWSQVSLHTLLVKSHICLYVIDVDSWPSSNVTATLVLKSAAAFITMACRLALVFVSMVTTCSFSLEVFSKTHFKTLYFTDFGWISYNNERSGILFIFSESL